MQNGEILYILQYVFDKVRSLMYDSQGESYLFFFPHDKLEISFKSGSMRISQLEGLSLIYHLLKLPCVEFACICHVIGKINV